MQAEATHGSGGTTGVLWWGVSVAVAVLLVRALPHVLTDGDSCLHAALARDMTRDGWHAWVAPEWARGGEWTWYREHPPGALWPAALLGVVGLEAAVAGLVANLFWTFAAVAGVAAVARRFVTREAAAVAALVFLLHVPSLRYVQRLGLELPFAATTVWSLAAALRLGGGWRWSAVLAASLAGAFLTRGVFGGVALALIVWVALEPALRPPPVRLLIAVLAAGLSLFVFDRLHAHVTGEGFWVAYFTRQVGPSLVAGGTQHSAGGRQFAYFCGRLAIYALPWALLPLWRLLRGPRWEPSAAAWRLLLAGVVVTYVGASVTTRPASRYLFAAWPCLAVLFAVALPRPMPRWLRSTAPWALLCAVPLLVATKSLTTGDDAWTRAAPRLHELAEQHDDRIEVRGEFDREDSRAKSFLRLHLDARALADGPGAGDAAWRVVPLSSAARRENSLLSLPFGDLVDPTRR